MLLGTSAGHSGFPVTMLGSPSHRVPSQVGVGVGDSGLGQAVKTEAISFIPHSVTLGEVTPCAGLATW